MASATRALPWGEAASIIMLSRSTRRVLLLRRGETAAFMPKALVFPGGVVHTQHEHRETSREAALRELFEETGVLCTEGSGLRTVEDPRTERWQTEVNEKGASKSKLREFLASAKESLAVSSLIPWSTWLTPNAGHYKRRYMTDFFVLPVDGEPVIRHCAREMAGAEWSDPSEVLAAAVSGAESVPPPQQYELSRLKELDPCTLPFHHIRKVLFPQLIKCEEEKDGGEEWLCNVLPGDQDYISEPAGQFNQGTRKMKRERMMRPDESKPLHRLTYLASPLYSKCTIRVKGVDPLALEEPHVSRL
ncbi:ndx-7 [Pristionchus pacificus]|uniref:Ndx-7 n=1 Tax=Pristionchus pacificus TaxID=54126 RepID=A0A2A6C8V8_PRIPA|nr:ndx-7 [Pristionchus pacificus]|eukprot:PDM74547.1 ndx-7 [Pristionchus pacificus]